MRKIPGVSIHWPAETKKQILASPGHKIVERWRSAHKQRGWRDILAIIYGVKAVA